jgi:hypothetical protein
VRGDPITSESGVTAIQPVQPNTCPYGFFELVRRVKTQTFPFSKVRIFGCIIVDAIPTFLSWIISFVCGKSFYRWNLLYGRLPKEVTSPPDESRDSHTPPPNPFTSSGMPGPRGSRQMPSSGETPVGRPKISAQVPPPTPPADDVLNDFFTSPMKDPDGRDGVYLSQQHSRKHLFTANRQYRTLDVPMEQMAETLNKFSNIKDVTFTGAYCVPPEVLNHVTVLRCQYSDFQKIKGGSKLETFTTDHCHAGIIDLSESTQVTEVVIDSLQKLDGIIFPEGRKISVRITGKWPLEAELNKARKLCGWPELTVEDTAEVDASNGPQPSSVPQNASNGPQSSSVPQNDGNDFAKMFADLLSGRGVKNPFGSSFGDQSSNPFEMGNPNAAMSYENACRVLGMGPSATRAEAKRIHSKLIYQYHPDKNPGNTEAERKAREINEAWGVIRKHRNW